jgi:hypothetical protein
LFAWTAPQDFNVQDFNVQDINVQARRFASPAATNATSGSRKA